MIYLLSIPYMEVVLIIAHTDRFCPSQPRIGGKLAFSKGYLLARFWAA